MKKILLLVVALATFTFTNAQDDNGGSATSEGAWLIEVNTGFGSGHAASTGFHLTSRDGTTAYNLGAEVGYFVMDDLAIKAGIGFGDTGVDGVDSTFSYKIGAKYYISSQFPVQVDYSGNNVENAAGESPSYFGIQGGYAWFIADNVTIEPGIRYNISMNDDFDPEDNIQFNIGFAIFL